MPRLKVLRERKFLSQRELAVKSGVHFVTIARIETGIVKPRFSTIRRLAKALGVEPADIK